MALDVLDVASQPGFMMKEKGLGVLDRERVLPKQSYEEWKHTVHCIRDLNGPSAGIAIVCTASSTSGGGPWELLGYDV